MKSVLVWVCLAVVLAGCAGGGSGSGPAGTREGKLVVDMHSSQNAFDWAGSYEGVLPCADCPGVKTRLVLQPDARYELSTQYLYRQPVPTVMRGKFSWNASGNAITLDGSLQHFAVGEGRLLLLDRDGPVDWTASPNRVLRRVSSSASAPSAAAGRVQTLESHRWTLESAVDGQGQRIAAVMPATGRPVVLSFSASTLHVQGGCNRLTGGYQVSSQGLLTVSRMASGMMACEPDLMQVDRVLSDMLANGLQVEMTNGAAPNLRLVDASRATLILTGQLTPEALYGTGVRIFMEIASQRVACKNPLNGETLCLQVRDRNYDEEGLLVGVPGEWRTLYETIEGYQHTPGLRNVVRLKKFQRPSAKTGAASTVYVLDLVVESEAVRR